MAPRRRDGEFINQKLRLLRHQSCHQNSEKCDKGELHSHQISLTNFNSYIHRMSSDFSQVLEFQRRVHELLNCSRHPLNDYYCINEAQRLFIQLKDVPGAEFPDKASELLSVPINSKYLPALQEYVQKLYCDPTNLSLGEFLYFVDDLLYSLTIRPDKQFWKVVTSDVFQHLVEVRWKLTAKLEIGSEDEGGRTVGTCFIELAALVEDRPCPCKTCQESGNPASEWGSLTFSTALHVLQDEDQSGVLKEMPSVEGAWVRLDYEVDEDEKDDLARTNVDKDNDPNYMPVLRVHSEDTSGDWCAIECVTHDLELVKQLEGLVDDHYSLGNQLRETWGVKSEEGLPVLIVSHPHGLAKRISLGRASARSIKKEVRDEQDFCHFDYTAVTCAGSSGGSVYVLGRWTDGFGYWFGHSHGHKAAKEKDVTCRSSDGVVSTWMSAV